MRVDAHVVFFVFFLCKCATDQEGGRWRSVSPEGALRVGLWSEGEGDGKNGGEFKHDIVK